MRLKGISTFVVATMIALALFVATFAAGIALYAPNGIAPRAHRTPIERTARGEVESVTVCALNRTQEDVGYRVVVRVNGKVRTSSTHDFLPLCP